MNTFKLLATIVMAVYCIAMLSTGCVEHPNPKADRHDQDEHQGHDHDDHEEHGDHDDHDDDGHDDHAGHDGHGEGAVVRLSAKEIDEIGVETAIAGSGELSLSISLPGEISIDPDRLAHIGPRVPGVVAEVTKRVGQKVEQGEVLATLESRDLADAIADYLAAGKKTSLAWSTYSREKGLWEKRITSEQEYLEAKNQYSEARIDRERAKQKLRILGLSPNEIEKLPGQPGNSHTRYQIAAPFAGTVIHRHATLGELVAEDEAAFIIADLSVVWVNLKVFQKDLAAIGKGQRVSIDLGHGAPKVHGAIDYVAPLVGEDTRTSTARVVLDNSEGKLLPGMFVTAKVDTKHIDAPVTAPAEAVQRIDGESVVFVPRGGGFTPRPVTVGAAENNMVEIRSGLSPGDEFVVKGAFNLKAKLITSALDPHAGHGH